MNTLRSDEVRIRLWTVGYNKRSRKGLIELLKRREIGVLIDVRRFPRSKILHFNKEEMERWLLEEGVIYRWLGEELGGFRRGGYAKYMETDGFGKGIKKLIDLARKSKVAIMCVEKDPSYCHRRFISERLREEGIEVVDIP